MNESENLDLSSSSRMDAGSTLEELRAEYQSLRKLFHIALAVLFIFTAGVNLYLLRQVISVRKDLASYRPRVNQMVSEFQKNGEPVLQQFVNNLQTYARTHPDFNPILTKYNIAPASGAINAVPATPPAK